MTGSSTVPPPSVQTSPRRCAWNEWVAWIVIVAAVGYVFVVNFRHAHAPASDSLPPSGQLLITSRYVVGFRQLPTVESNPAASPALLMKGVSDNATTKADRLRVVPVAGELLGAKAALERLDKLRPDLSGTPLESDAAALRVIYQTGPVDLTSAQRSALLSDHNWFGALAVSFGKPDSDPVRHEALHQAQLTFGALIGLCVVGAFGFLIGFVLLVVALVFWSDGKLRLAYRPTA
ncbi:MAG TPA: hypothetical protein VGD75_10710, partial [Bradyrhizobium sp.]